MKRQANSSPVADGGRSVPRRRFSDSSSVTKMIVEETLGAIKEDETLDNPEVPKVIFGNPPADDDDEDDDASVISINAELLTSFLPKAKSKDFPKDFPSLEIQVLETVDMKNLPTKEVLLSQLHENPRASILAQMGEKRLESSKQTLATECAKWQVCGNGYAEKEKEALVKEHNDERFRQVAYEKLQQAAREYHNLDVAYSTSMSSRQDYGKKKERCQRKYKLGQLLLGDIQSVCIRDYSRRKLWNTRTT